MGQRGPGGDLSQQSPHSSAKLFHRAAGWGTLRETPPLLLSNTALIPGHLPQCKPSYQPEFSECILSACYLGSSALSTCYVPGQPPRSWCAGSQAATPQGGTQLERRPMPAQADSGDTGQEGSLPEGPASPLWGSLKDPAQLKSPSARW